MTCDICAEGYICSECEKEKIWKKIRPDQKPRLMAWARAIKNLDPKETDFWDWGKANNLDPIDIPKSVWSKI